MNIYAHPTDGRFLLADKSKGMAMYPSSTFICSLDARTATAMEKADPTIWRGKFDSGGYWFILLLKRDALIARLEELARRHEPTSGKWFPLDTDEVDINHVASGLVDILKRHAGILKEAA